MATEASPYLTMDEARLILRISRDTLSAWLHQGKLPGSVKFGHVWRIPRKAVEPAVPPTGAIRGDSNAYTVGGSMTDDPEITVRFGDGRQVNTTASRLELDLAKLRELRGEGR